MRILIDIKHPAHVHVFKNFIIHMKKKGHDVMVTAREKEMTTYLLNKYGIPFTTISKIGKSKIALLKELILRNWKFYLIARKFKPNLMMELMGVTGAPVGWFMRVPSLVYYDTENARLTNKIAYTFCTKFVTPNCYKEKLGKKNLRYKGYHELAYLHPNYFKPDFNIIKDYVNEGERFTIVRFVSWGASHDIGHPGITEEMKIKAVKEFAKYGKVFITSEKNVPKEIEQYKLKLPPEHIHHLQAYATLLFGESATMASECACLGTYSIYIDNEGRGYTDEEEKKYQLVFNFSESADDQKKAIKKGIDILKRKDPKKEAMAKAKKLLADTVDVTDYMMKLAVKYGKKGE